MKKLAGLRSDGLELAIFPSQDFGAQELKSDSDVTTFAASSGFEGVVFQTGPVASRPVFRHCLEATGSEAITWNFRGLFLVSRSGVVSVPGKNVEADIHMLLAEEA